MEAHRTLTGNQINSPGGAVGHSLEKGRGADSQFQTHLRCTPKLPSPHPQLQQPSVQPDRCRRVLRDNPMDDRCIYVALRCRPGHATMGNTSSDNRIVWDSFQQSVGVRTQGNDGAPQQTYRFDKVFSTCTSQEQVFSALHLNFSEVFSGRKYTVIAYGQMGTGKTHTMMGSPVPDVGFTWYTESEAGFIPRAIHYIFDNWLGSDFSVKVSLLEIYNEELFDLLSEDMPEQPQHLQLYNDPQHGTVVRGLRQVTLREAKEAYRILERGFARRKTAHTPINAHSSRSHVMVSLTVTSGGRVGPSKTGTLNLVDLASSENFGHYRVPDERAQEAEYIHQSLMALRRVIAALVQRRPDVPYRDSILTHVLQDSLEGRTKTTIIATVPRFFSNLQETQLILQSASNARSIVSVVDQRRAASPDTSDQPYRRLL